MNMMRDLITRINIIKTKSKSITLTLSTASITFTSFTS